MKKQKQVTQNLHLLSSKDVSTLEAPIRAQPSDGAETGCGLCVGLHVFTAGCSETRPFHLVEEFHLRTGQDQKGETAEHGADSGERKLSLLHYSITSHLPISDLSVAVLLFCFCFQ